MNDNITETIKQWFKDNPNPKDDDVHALANQLQMPPDELEEAIYAVLSSMMAEAPVEQTPDSVTPPVGAEDMYGSQDIRQAVKLSYLDELCCLTGRK